MVVAGGVGIFRVLKTRNLLILRDAKNAQNSKIAPNWNVSGTRKFRRLRLCGVKDKGFARWVSVSAASQWTAVLLLDNAGQALVGSGS
jgi:hypothetical protein